MTEHQENKCSGHPPPCQMCEQLDTPCVIDLTMDMRRRTALQRTLEESKAFQDTLAGTIDILRTGSETDIQNLISHVQHISDDEELIGMLHATFQNKAEAASPSIKEELEETANFGSEAEESDNFNTVPSSTCGPSRKRSSSMQEVNFPRSSASPIPFDHMGKDKAGSLASQYLPLISKLRTVSDLEALRILHDFRTAPIDGKGVPTLILIDSRPTRPGLNTQISGYSHRPSNVETAFPDRTGWHPSLQVTTAGLPTPVTRSSSQVQWSAQSGPSNVNQVCTPLCFGWRRPDFLRSFVTV
jgi:hypothetical protein